MSTRAVSLILYLGLGVLLNLGTSIGGALCLTEPHGDGGMYVSDTHAEEFRRQQITEWWDDRNPSVVQSHPDGLIMDAAPALRIFWITTSARSPTSPSIEVLLLRSGWPFPALEGSVWQDYTTEPMQTHKSTMILLRDSGRVHPHLTKWLPYRPLPIGFVANTAFYTFTTAIIGVGLQMARRRACRACARCSHCAYPLRTGSPFCSECGAGASPAED